MCVRACVRWAGLGWVGLGSTGSECVVPRGGTLAAREEPWCCSAGTYSRRRMIDSFPAWLPINSTYILVPCKQASQLQ